MITSLIDCLKEKYQYAVCCFQLQFLFRLHRFPSIFQTFPHQNFCITSLKMLIQYRNHPIQSISLHHLMIILSMLNPSNVLPLIWSLCHSNWRLILQMKVQSRTQRKRLDNVNLLYSLLIFFHLLRQKLLSQFTVHHPTPRVAIEIEPTESTLFFPFLLRRKNGKIFYRRCTGLSQDGSRHTC